MAEDLYYNIRFAGTEGALSKLAEITAKIRELKKLIQDPNTPPLDVEKSKIALKSLEKEYRDLQSTQNKQIIANKSEGDSLDSLRSKLSMARAQFDAMSKAERESATGGKALLKSIQNLDKEIKHIEETTGRYQRNVGNYGKFLGGIIKGATMAWAEVAWVAYKAVSFFHDSLMEYDKAIKAEAQLRNALGGREEITKNLLEYSVRLMESTGIPHDIIDEQMVFLAAQGRSEEAIKKEIKAAIQLSIVTGKDLPSAVKLLDASYYGVLGELNRLDPAFKSMTTEQLRNGEAIDFVNQKYQGFAEAAISVGAGPLTKLSNTWNEIKESIGQGVAKAILPATTAIRNFLNSFRDIEPMKTESQLARERLDQFNLEIETLKTGNMTEDARRLLINEINKKYADYLPNLLTEKTRLEDINKAQISVNDSMMQEIIFKGYKEELAAAIEKEVNARKSLAQASLEEAKAAQLQGKETQFVDIQTQNFRNKLRETSKETNQMIVDNSQTTKTYIEDVYKEMAKQAGIAWETIMGYHKKTNNGSAGLTEEEKKRQEELNKEIENIEKEQTLFYKNEWEKQKQVVDDKYKDLFIKAKGNKEQIAQLTKLKNSELEHEWDLYQDKIFKNECEKEIKNRKEIFEVKKSLGMLTASELAEAEITELKNKHMDELMSIEDFELAKAIIYAKYQIKAVGTPALTPEQQRALDDKQFALEQAALTTKGKIDELKKQYDAGVIGEKRYKSEVKKIYKTLLDEKKEILKQSIGHAKGLFKENTIAFKALSLAEIYINTKKGALEAIAMARLFPYNWILAALITASGIKAALDVANIKIAERGAIIGGYSHSQGGTMINAEKDEVIINKRSAQKFLPELSAINSYRGWGVPFAERGAIIPSMETNRGMTREEAIKLFEGGFNAIKVYVSEREITTIQNRVKATEYESRF